MWTTYTNGSDEPNDPNHASYAEANSGDPGGISKLCLSCHDGSVAANQYGFAPSSSRHTSADQFVNSSSRASIGYGGDLSNHHPIGFVYADAQASDDEIAATSATLGQYTIGDLLWQGKMECSTCHDVHNTKNTGEKFLWVTDKNSGLCLTCHLKNQ
jgi:predicted CXXCH cytochrome family protein